MRAIVKDGLRPRRLRAVGILGNQPRLVAGGGHLLLSGTRCCLLPHRSSRVSTDPLDVVRSARVARREPWFYLRLGTPAGLTLLRVLREGLWLGTCLGVTLAGRNAS